MMTDESKRPEWVYRGKSIHDLIKELQSFDDEDGEVQISVDYGDSRKPISLVVERDGRCLLMFCGE
jgi:hypothetical protein